MALMVVGVACSGCGRGETDSHLVTVETGTLNVVAEESGTAEVHTDVLDVSNLEVVASTVSKEAVVTDTECFELASECEEDNAFDVVAEEMQTEVSPEKNTESTEADVPESASEVTTEVSAEETTEEPAETNTPTETPVEQTTEKVVEEAVVAYDPNYIVALCNEKIKAYGKILIWENLDNLLVEGKIT